MSRKAFESLFGSNQTVPRAGDGYDEGENPSNKVLYINMAPFGFNFLRGKDMENLLDYSRAIWQAATAAAPEQPSWQDAPTCAGVWVRNSGDCIGAYLIHESAIPILQGSRSRWFGPLPEDKQ